MCRGLIRGPLLSTTVEVHFLNDKKTDIFSFGMLSLWFIFYEVKTGIPDTSLLGGLRLEKRLSNFSRELAEERPMPSTSCTSGVIDDLSEITLLSITQSTISTYKNNDCYREYFKESSIPIG